MQHLQPNTTLQGGKYRIERVLGQGGFGITYLAEQVSAHRRVAIKELFIASQGQAVNGRNGNNVTVTNAVNQVLFDKHKEKFEKEASRLATLRHKNLVRVYEWFEENGTVYYVMDFIEGETLRDKLNREGALQESLVMNYLQQLLSALQVVHEKNIWHLDIKPLNIMVDRNNHVYLIDFGASKHIEQKNGTLSTSSMLVGSPGYYPPEQSSETMKNIGAWTDMYALGATLYNLLTRRNPPTFDVIISEGRNAFSFPSNISSQTRDLIIRMMKVNKNERPQSVKELLQSPSSCEETIIEKPKSYAGNNIIENARETKYKRETAEIEEKCSPYWVSFACPFVFMACWFVYLSSDKPDLGIIILSLFVGVPISFIISRFLYNSIKKSRIEKWKMEHPNDPRNKYLHFYKDV